MAGYRPIDDKTIDDFLGWLDGMADQNVEVKTIGEVMGGGVTAPQVAVTGPADGTTVRTAQPQAQRHQRRLGTGVGAALPG